MGSIYGGLVKIVIQVLIGLVVLAIVGYAVYSWAESGFEEERVEYRSTIAEIAIEKETLIVEKVEHKAVEAFEQVEEKIDAESNVTRSYTKEKVKDEEVTEFTDSF